MLIFGKQPYGPTELEFELWILDWLEKQCYDTLDGLGIPEDIQQYYLGFAKRLWERALLFTQDTFQLEKTSLKTEYVMRGLNLTVLEAIQGHIEEAAEYKRTHTYPPGKLVSPPANSYFNLEGTVDLREQGGYYNRISGQVALYVDAPPSQHGGYFNRT